MMKVTENFNIKCNKCGYITLIYSTDLEYTEENENRPMGVGINYDFYNEINCENCKSNIRFDIIACEYPLNGFDYVNYSCYGGTFINNPNVQIEYYEFNDYYTDYAYEEYLKAEAEMELKKEYIKNMSPIEFELFVGELFKHMGFIVKTTQPTRDGGYDIIATKSTPFPFTLIVECKHYNDNHKVGVNIIRNVYGTQTAMQANQSVIVTSSKFTKDAKKFASSRSNLMQLIDINDLLMLMQTNLN